MLWASKSVINGLQLARLGLLLSKVSCESHVELQGVLGWFVTMALSKNLKPGCSW